VRGCAAAAAAAAAGRRVTIGKRQAMPRACACAW
jgi:hypothetical protein